MEEGTLNEKGENMLNFKAKKTPKGSRWIEQCPHCGRWTQVGTQPDGDLRRCIHCGEKYYYKDAKQFKKIPRKKHDIL